MTQNLFDTPLFDTHAHIVSDDLDRYPYGTLRGGGKLPVPPLVFTVADLVRAMDEADVAHACLVQRATLYGYDNRYALDAAAAYPDRFVPVAVLDAQDPGAPAQLRDLAAAHRLGGLRIVAPGLSRTETDWLGGAEALDLWRAAADLALPVAVILYRYNNEAALPVLLGIARRFPDLPILVDHVGVPHASTPETRWAQSQGIDYVIPPPPGFGIAQSLAPFDDLGNVHFKITDINFDRLHEAGADPAAFVRALADRFGPARLVFGSDVGQSPAPYADMIRLMRASAALLSQEERAQFLGGTALRLYGGKLASALTS